MPRAKREKSEHYLATKERVVDVSAALFARRGYSATGVAEICEAAGLARGALYYYIGSKEELLSEIHDRVMLPLLDEAVAVEALDLSVRARLRLLSESLLWQIVHRHDHVWVFLHEHRQLLGAERQEFQDKRRRFEDVLAGLLGRARAEGLVAVTDVELATLAFLNLHNYTYQWLGGRRVLEVEELARFYCGIFLDGVGVDPSDDGALSAELETGRAALLETRSAARPVAGGSPQTR